MHATRSALKPTVMAIALFAAACGSPTATEERHVSDEVLTAVAEEAAKAREDLVRIRQDLHRNPELSNQEERTGRVVAERLRELGLDADEMLDSKWARQVKTRAQVLADMMRTGTLPPDVA